MEKDYKNTLILPTTNFSMRGNLPQKEPLRYRTWQEYAYKIMSARQDCRNSNNTESDYQDYQDSREIYKDIESNLPNSKEDFKNIESENLDFIPLPQFNLHDGPPYANGHLHVGHALNKILKDFIVKYHFFSGKQVFYTLGWDCHGLPIEQQVSNIFEQKGIKPTTLETREACREHARKFVEIQSKEFLNMGIVGDFANPYLTMKYHFEADIYRAIVKIANNDLLVQRSKPIFWSWAAKSALADAEVEYKDKKSDSVFVRFRLSPEAINVLGLNDFTVGMQDLEDSENTKTKELESNEDSINSQKAHLAPSNPMFSKSDSYLKKQKGITLNNLGENYPHIIIWTTTPWTLPSNVAIAFKPQESYVLTTKGEIVAKKLYENLRAKNIVTGECIRQFSSHDFENLSAINPLNDRESRLILADYVSLEDGSGAVHNAPGHGEDDYFVCLRYDLPVIMPVDDSGCFDVSVKSLGLFRSDVADEFVGQHIFKVQKRILELLKEQDSLVWHEEITHSYPHCWRTNKPVIFRATKQWFILMDKPYHNGKTLRDVALEEIEKVRFYPENGKNRLKSMLENRPDWCISRQRDWGVPIAFFVHKDSGEPLLDPAVTSHIANLFEQNGCDVWWSKDISELLPESFKAVARKYKKNMHILDVWFESGSTWSAVLSDCVDGEQRGENNSYNAGSYPASVYLEGSDQHRGWFQSSLLVSCAINFKAPFKSIVTHGFTIDEKSEKMSKSKGNVLAPSEIISQYGSEILRLWVALSDYQNDVKISQNILKQASENYMKLRNTIRFLLANTNDLKSLDFKNLRAIDMWVLGEFLSISRQVDSLFSIYDFSKGFQLLNGFITTTLSGIYLDICKDSLYCDGLEAKRRVAIQSVLSVIANHLLHTLAPFITYTVDEALEYAPEVIKNVAKNVFLLKKIELPYLLGIESGDKENITKILELRKIFNENIDRLKKEGIVKSSLELEIAVDCKGDSEVSVDSKCDFNLIEELLMVSGVFMGEAWDSNIACGAKGTELKDSKNKNYRNVESKIDSLKDSKDSQVLHPKSCNHLSLQKDSHLMSCGSSDSISKDSKLFSINFDNKIFNIYKSSKKKCPRCWQYKIVNDECLCMRCADVVGESQ